MEKLPLVFRNFSSMLGRTSYRKFSAFGTHQLGFSADGDSRVADEHRQKEEDQARAALQYDHQDNEDAASISPKARELGVDLPQPTMAPTEENKTRAQELAERMQKVPGPASGLAAGVKDMSKEETEGRDRDFAQ